MALIVVVSDMMKVHRLRNLRQIVDVPGEAPEGRILDYAPQVALEMPVVHGIEPHERGEQPDVGFGELISRQKARCGQTLLKPIESLEQGHDGFLICDL